MTSLATAYAPSMRFWVKAKLLLILSIFTMAAVEFTLRLNPPESVYMNTRNIIQQISSVPIESRVLGYVPRANFTTPFDNREFRTTVMINSQNMRDKEYSRAKPPGTRRIVAVGDSFVFGWGVEDKERATELLEDRYLRNVEVLNLGVSGYRANEELEWLKVRGLAFKPDVVLFFTLGLPSSSHEKYGFRNGKLYWEQALRQPLTGTAKNWLSRNVYIMAAISSLNRRKTAAPIETWEDNILADLGALAKRARFKAIVVYLPDEKKLREPNAKLADLASSCRKKDLGFLDSTPALTDSWLRLKKYPYFRYDDHWNRHGHEAAAGAIAEYLFKNRFFDPKSHTSR